MAIEPIFKDGLPLFIDDNGALKPAQNEEACACCGNTYNYCACSCSTFVPQIQEMTVTSVGFRDYSCGNPPCGSFLGTHTVLNGSWTMAVADPGHTPHGQADFGVQGDIAHPGLLFVSNSPPYFNPRCPDTRTYFWRLSIDQVLCVGSPSSIRADVTFLGQVFSNGAFIGLTVIHQFFLSGSWNSICTGTSPFMVSGTGGFSSPCFGAPAENVIVTASATKINGPICP